MPNMELWSQSCLHHVALGRTLYVALIIFSCVSFIGAQSAEDVQIVPRAPDEPGAVASRSSADLLPASARALRVDVNLVLVPVTVIDAKNRPVANLGSQDFQLFEGERRQEIKFFSIEDAPISVGLIVDLSGSMANKIDEVRYAVNEFFVNANPQDDYFVVTVSDTPKVLANTTQSIGTIQEKLGSVPPGGYTALLDAIYLAETKLRNARYQRKALVIVSDGGDNISRYSLREIKSLVQETDAIIYAMGLFDGLPFIRSIEEKFGRHLLDQVTEATGGRTLPIDNAAKLPQAAMLISRELRSQYVLGYNPNADSRDGKWKKIRVKVNPQGGHSRVQAFYKKGYSASQY